MGEFSALLDSDLVFESRLFDGGAFQASLKVLSCDDLVRCGGRLGAKAVKQHTQVLIGAIALQGIVTISASLHPFGEVAD